MGLSCLFFEASVARWCDNAMVGHLWVCINDSPLSSVLCVNMHEP